MSTVSLMKKEYKLNSAYTNLYALDFARKFLDIYPDPVKS